MREELPKIPSEFIEPYLAQFMGNMVEFMSNARTTEEKEKLGGVGWTAEEVKHWVKGVELFVSWYCGIHAKYAMMNAQRDFDRIPNDKLQEICKSVVNDYLHDY